jgi:hypothetical protein
MVTPALTGIERFEQYKNYYEYIMSVVEQAEKSDKRARISESVSFGKREVYLRHNGFREVFGIEKFGKNFILIPYEEGIDYAHGHYCYDTRFRHVITRHQYSLLMEKLEKLKNN